MGFRLSFKLILRFRSCFTPFRFSGSAFYQAYAIIFHVLRFGPAFLGVSVWFCSFQSFGLGLRFLSIRVSFTLTFYFFKILSLGFLLLLLGHRPGLSPLWFRPGFTPFRVSGFTRLTSSKNTPLSATCTRGLNPDCNLERRRERAESFLFQVPPKSLSVETVASEQ